jgi:hypothetical protein
MINKINELKKKVGTPYEMFFADGNYNGCFFPVYELYPFLPKYPLYSKNMTDNWDYGVNLIKKHAVEIDASDVQEGDIMVTRFRNELHVAICLGGRKILHVFKDYSLEISRIENYFRDKYIKYYRVIDNA